MRRLVIVTLLLGLITGTAIAAEPAQPAGPRQGFVVFFQEWSAALDDSAQKVIGNAADYAKAHADSFVHVNGFADPTGSRKANVLLADLRMQVVIDRLEADGVPPSHIVGRGHGPVKFGLTSQESRRVAISIGKR
jgi:outer membrane protein OmpA-like peptidoglycan-associated protein